MLAEWPSVWRYYLRHNGDSFIGPFKSMTAAYRHRRDYGPVGASISQAPDHYFAQSLFPAMSAEQHRWLIAVEAS